MILGPLQGALRICVVHSRQSTARAMLLHRVCLKSILPKPRPRSACVQLCWPGSSVPARRGSGPVEDTNQTFHWKQTVFAVTGEGVTLHTSFSSLSVPALLRAISMANPFLNVFISMCKLRFRERNLELRQALSRNSGKGNGIVK